MAYFPGGPYVSRGAYTDTAPTTNATPYIEQDKAARTTAIFQGIQGIITSAADYYQRIKYNARPAAGSPYDSNVYYGGGVSYIPGDSGEPTKLVASGPAGFTTIALILGVIVLAFVLLRK